MKKKETLKSVKAAFATYVENAQKFMYTLQNPSRRALLTVDAVASNGQLNGMTIVELITVINLSAGTNERVYLTAKNKSITAWAEKVAPQAPMELL